MVEHAWARAGGSKPWSAASSSIRARRNCSSPASASPSARLTLPSPRAAEPVRLGGVAGHALFPQERGDVGLGQRVEPDDLAPRDDRVELDLRRGADQDQHRARRRLLQRLQEGVGRLLVEVVGVVEDRHLARAPRRLEREVPAEVADHLDRQLVLVLGPGGLEEIGVGAGLDLEAAGADLARVERLGGAGLAEQGLRQLPREGPLADPLGADEQQGVREPPVLEAPPQLRHDAVMAADRVPGHAPPRS